MTDAAFKAEFSDFKLVKTRSTAQIVLELPIEQADAALKALGGVPKPGVTVWVAVAVMGKEATSEPVEKPKRSWDEIPLPEQAGIRCNDPQFQEWFWRKTGRKMTTAPDDLTEWTVMAVKRGFCFVNSRSELSPDNEAGQRWITLDQEYQNSCGLIAERTT